MENIQFYAPMTMHFDHIFFQLSRKHGQPKIAPHFPHMHFLSAPYKIDWQLVKVNDEMKVKLIKKHA